MNRQERSMKRKEERTILNCMSGQPLIGRLIIFCYDLSFALDSPVVENYFWQGNRCENDRHESRASSNGKCSLGSARGSTKKHRRAKVRSILSLDFPTVCDVMWLFSPVDEPHEEVAAPPTTEATEKETPVESSKADETEPAAAAAGLIALPLSSFPLVISDLSRFVSGYQHHQRICTSIERTF